MKGTTRTLMALAIGLGAAACGPDMERDSDVAVRDTAAQPAAELSPERLEALRERVPQLAQERAPAPTPSPGATPGQVPQRVAHALPDDVLETVTGEATFYADKFEGRRTASGIPFRQNQMVAAHRAYPFGTILRVTNTRNDRAVTVRVVDRGPFGSSAKARKTVLDLSRRAAEQLDYIGAGRTPVKVEVLQWGKGIRA